MRDGLIVVVALLMLAGCRPETQRTDSVDPSAQASPEASQFWMSSPPSTPSGPSDQMSKV